MSIAIVSALPSSTVSTASANAGVDVATQGVESDFTRLLFGQITAALGASERFADKALATDDREVSDASLPEDETTPSGDPQNLLAVLAQAPVEQRSASVPVTVPAQQAESKIAAGITTQAPSRGSGDPAAADPAATETSLRPVDARDQHAAPEISPTLSDAAEQRATSWPSPRPVDERASAEAGVPAAKFAAPAKDADAVRSDKPLVTTESSTPPALTAPAAVDVRHSNENASPRLGVNTPLHDRAWKDDFAQRVTWLAGQHKQAAELTLNPPSMGSIEISLKLDRETSSATASFVSTNAEVRETIESALPRLREMLAGVGIELGQAQVSAESFRQSNGNEARQQNDAPPSRNDMAILATDSLPAQRTISIGAAGRGLVDIFA